MCSYLSVNREAVQVRLSRASFLRKVNFDHLHKELVYGLLDTRVITIQ